MGACVLGCGGGTTRCGDRCAALDADAKNCGACGHACAPGLACVAGICGVICNGGTTLCGGACVDTLVDSAHCGSCDTRCPDHSICTAGACVPVPCGPGTIACNMRCVDAQIDPANCGACGQACQKGMVCAGGQCMLDCGVGRLACNGACVDTTSDPGNCGACGVACGKLQGCVKGACACNGGLMPCNGGCVDTMSESTNCGGCGNVCPNGKVCFNGVCSLPLSPWRMLGNDPQHTGYNGNESGGPPGMNPDWTVKLSNAALRQAVSEDGRIFVTSALYFVNVNPVWALDAATGKQLWTYNFGNINAVGFPTVSGGVAYVPQNNEPGTHVWAFDAKTGNGLFSAPMAAQWETYWSPLVVNGQLYSDGGSYGGLYGFNAITGAQLFFNNTLEQYDEWSPAWFGGAVYSFVAGNLRAHDAKTGVVQWKVSVNWNWAGWSMTTAPVFSSSLGYVIAPPNLYAIDPVQQKVAWTANGAFQGTAAVANGVVYAITQGNLQARDAATGMFLWSFAGDGGLSYPPVITPRFVYVSSGTHTYAVDPSQHSATWTANVGGWLSVAAGKLLIASANGTLSAYGL